MKKYLQLYQTLLDAIQTGSPAPGDRLPTESELAARYGMSRQTVRQALELLKRDGAVRSVQGSGSYVSPAARTARQDRRIAVVTTYFSEYIFPSILRGISETAMENGYTVQINATNNSISTEKDILLALLDDPVAGVIVEGTKSALPNSNIPYYQQLARRGVPIVFINGIYPQLKSEGFLSVVSDDAQGGYRLARRLLGEGHTRIGCFFKSDDAQGIDRFSGVLSALSESQVRFDDRNFIWFTTETKRSFLQALPSDRLLNDCTALICYNDEIAATIASYLKRHPNNIHAIASFDGNLNPDILPEHTAFFSLGHPKDLLGRTAAQKLFNLLYGKQESSAVLPWID